MKIPFAKGHATGNDFILFLAAECPEIIRDPHFITNICRRRTGIGADSVLVLSNESGYDYRMDYYNSDGSWETMCANGSRCAALYMYQRELAGNEISFITGDGPHKVLIQDALFIRLKMTPPEYTSESLQLGRFSGRQVDSGAAHFVTEAKEYSMDQGQRDAPEIRYAKCFQPRGTNVNFYEVTGPNCLSVFTYEKGIEKMMLSCGSGSVAAAYHAFRVHGLTSPITINVPGGKLTVEFDLGWNDVWLSGPAVILFNALINPADFQ